MHLRGWEQSSCSELESVCLSSLCIPRDFVMPERLTVQYLFMQRALVPDWWCSPWRLTERAFNAYSMVYPENTYSGVSKTISNIWDGGKSAWKPEGRLSVQEGNREGNPIFFHSAFGWAAIRCHQQWLESVSPNQWLKSWWFFHWGPCSCDSIWGCWQ